MNDKEPPRIANGFFGTGSSKSGAHGPTRPSGTPKRATDSSSKRPARDKAIGRKENALPRSTGRSKSSSRASSQRSATGSTPRPRVSARTAARRSAAPTVPSRRRHVLSHAALGPKGHTPHKALASPTRRYFGLGVLLCFLLATTVGKLADLQVVNPARYRSAGVAQRTVHVALPAARGALLDRNGRDMAVSVPRSTVVVDPTQVKSVGREAALLAPILAMRENQLSALLRKPGRFVYLARLIEPATERKISKLLDKGLLSGVSLIPEYQRLRPNGTQAQSILGTTDIDGNGISGLELQYNKFLLGSPGEVTYERSALGPIAGGQIQSHPSVMGDDLQLTLDLPLQYETAKLVARQVAKTGSKSGIAIVSRPSTGEILAMVTQVADPKTGRVATSTNNEAVTTVYEPGSVNKVITVAKALANGVVTPSTVLDHPSTLTLGGATFGEAETLPSRMSVTDILTVSSNIGTIELAQKLGPKTVDSAIRDFGFGKKTALKFPNESPGLLLPLDQWSGSSIGSIPIGQGISVTALQMLQAYSTIANNGVAVPPRIVNATVDSSGQRHVIHSAPGHRVIPARTARQVRGILANVVTNGTGAKAAVPGYQVAGKTGTARKPLDKHQPGNGYLDLNGNYHYASTFVGMLPANDPQLSIIVVLDDPDRSKSYYASDTAAPLFSQIARAAVQRLRIPPSLATDVTHGLPALNPQLASGSVGER